MTKYTIYILMLFAGLNTFAQTNRNRVLYFGQRDSIAVSDYSKIKTFDLSGGKVYYTPVVADTNVCILGNSTIAAYDEQASVASLLPSGWTITDISDPGDQIVTQKNLYLGLETSVKQAFNYVFIQIGLNDLNPINTTAEQKLDAYQVLVDSVISQSPNAKIITCTMTPCRDRLTYLYGEDGPLAYQKWLDMNEGMTGHGEHAITGMDSYINQHTDLLNDGSGNLKTIYDTGDHIHETTSARQIIANLWVQRVRQDFQNESKSLFARLSELDDNTRYAIDSMIVMLKDSSIWDNSDLIYVMNMSDSTDALEMWKDTSNTLNGVGSFDFTPKSGFTSDGETGYLKTGYVPENADKLKLSSVFASVFSNTNSASGALMEFGASTTTEGTKHLYTALDNNGSTYFALNGNYTILSAGTITNTIGLFTSTRNETNVTLYNGSQSVKNETRATSGLPAVEIYILAFNSNGTAAQFSPRQISFFACGSYLTPAQVRGLNNIITWWNNKVNEIF